MSSQKPRCAATSASATSSATLERVMPNVAPFALAMENANSSAAARVAASTRIGGSFARMRARAASRRAAADGKTMEVRAFIRTRPSGPRANRQSTNDTSPVCQ
ncbi:hypothetical protein D3C83_60050 [compost metagenome]